MIDVNQCDVSTLFMFRFALDKANDTVDLRKDIDDLSSFPERLTQSYLAEWRCYVKRELSKIQKNKGTKKQALKDTLMTIQKGENQDFNHLYERIKTAEKVNNSPSVTVMTTPLKSFVNQLLKL